MGTQKAAHFTNPILDHFHHPRNVGIAREYNHSYLEQDNPWLIRLRFTLRVEDGRIQEVRFQTQSCVTTIACASVLTEMAWGQTVQSAAAITPEQLSEYLGTIPAEKLYCARLAVATLRKALETFSTTNATENSLQGGGS